MGHAFYLLLNPPPPPPPQKKKIKKSINKKNRGHARNLTLSIIFIIFGSKLCRQIVDVPICTNCAPVFADLFLFCNEKDFILSDSLSDNNKADGIEILNSTSGYLDELLNIDNPYFEQKVSQIYPIELKLNKANSSDANLAPFLDLDLAITNGIVSHKKSKYLISHFLMEMFLPPLHVVYIFCS